MATVNDAKFEYLRTNEFEGSINDMYLVFLQDQVVSPVGESIPDLQLQWMREQLVVSGGAFPDLWYEYLDGLAPGTVGRDINSLTLWYWESGAP